MKPHFFRLCMTFKDLLSSPDRKFLELFTPTFTRTSQQEGPSVAGAMSKIPTSGSKLPAASRLVKPESEAISKRPREGSLDLETGLEAKKTRIDTLHVPGNGTNLTKSKRKSMMSIAGGKIPKLLLLNKSKYCPFSWQQTRNQAHPRRSDWSPQPRPHEVKSWSEAGPWPCSSQETDHHCAQ